MKTAAPLLYARLGPADHRWLYRDADGTVVGAVLRWDLPDGEKRVRPVARVEGEWREAAMPEPRPLYRLPELFGDPTRPVLVVEGEKAADAAVRALQEVEDAPAVTTWPGGCATPGKADWSPLSGRSVRIWPDADEPGAKAARAVAGCAHAAGAGRIERLRVAESWHPGLDAADLTPGAVRRIWSDPARWEELDVARALARRRAREARRRAAAARARRRSARRGRRTGPSPEWERQLERARSLTALEVAQLLGCGEPVKRGREVAVRCPLHEDHNPSLRIAADGRRWFCDPCGEGGDPLALYLRARPVDFATAVRELAS